MQATSSARAAAAELILGVTEGRVPLNDQIGAGALAALVPAERARAQRLALASLRTFAQSERVLKPFLRKEPPAFVRALLQLAVTEMLGHGAPAHGVVHEMVSLTRTHGRKTDGFAGMVNAVLRRVAATDPAIFAAEPPQQLPSWLRGRLMSARGKPATRAIEAAHAKGAATDLTPRDGDGAGLAARLGGRLLPTGSVRLEGQPHISELDGFAVGDWWVQDAAAACAARVLDAKPGERVLDLCAAPGGKTLQLAAAGAHVTALDLSPARMARVEENLKRCRLSADLVVADALGWVAPAHFDAVLLDAPCSATGTIRRHPDLPFVRDPSGLKELFALQASLIDRAVAMIRPGGRLVFATCSLLPDEGERQITAALTRHANLGVDGAAVARLPGIDPGWITADGGLRLRPDHWPEIGGMDGFFIACLRLG
jgi:16S rRNA (cytosine967-C5)-methyltransferase